MMISKISLKTLFAGAFLAFAFGHSAFAGIEIGGARFDDTVKVAGKDLKLNGAGMRTKFVIKVYAAAFYLTEKKTSTAEIMAIPGPRRVSLVMMRDISSDDFGEKFMTGLNKNSDRTEQSKILNQTMQFGEMFALLPGLKKGDVLYLDWIPGTGTQCQLNGKNIGEVVPDLIFYNAIMRIWIGDKPADSSLKRALLGGR